MKNGTEVPEEPGAGDGRRTRPIINVYFLSHTIMRDNKATQREKKSQSRDLGSKQTDSFHSKEFAKFLNTLSSGMQERFFFFFYLLYIQFNVTFVFLS